MQIALYVLVGLGLLHYFRIGASIARKSIKIYWGKEYKTLSWLFYPVRCLLAELGDDDSPWTEPPVSQRTEMDKYMAYLVLHVMFWPLRIAWNLVALVGILVCTALVTIVAEAAQE